MSYKEAYQAVTGQNPSFAGSNTGKRNSGSKSHFQRPYQSQNYSFPSRVWLDQAEELVQKAHNLLMHYRLGLEYLQQRGFILDFIESQRFGWIKQDKFYGLDKWGLQGHKNKRIWVPQGLLIPMWQFVGDCPFPDPVKIKIRRPEEERENSIQMQSIGRLEGLTPGLLSCPNRAGIIDCPW